VYSAAAKTEWLEDWARMSGTECIVIDGESRPDAIRKELFWNDAAYRLAR
jgi:L-arabinose isomerase